LVFPQSCSSAASVRQKASRDLQLIDACHKVRRVSWVSLALALFLAASPVSLAAAASPAHLPAPPRVVPPSGVRASAGTTGTIAVVRWATASGANAYRIWRSSRVLGGFEPVGSSQSTSFIDASGVPGRTYFYQVTALLPSGDESGPSTATPGVTADWNESPHANNGKGNLCLTCHSLHRGDGQDDVAAGEVAICESCHDGAGARANVKDGPTDSFALASGHRVEEATRGADLTNECSSCHSPHADPRKRTGLYRKKVAGHTIGGGNAWCDACHDDKDSWRPGYPATGNVSRDASGYPVLGTYPGPTVYDATAKDGHAGIDAGAGRPKGDCLLCHAAHRGQNRYDGLLLTFVPPSASTVASDQAEGTYAALCLGCHGGQKAWAGRGAVDIARYVTRRDADGYAGHSIVTSGGTLPVGAPVPCYDCHNAHGSARRNGSLISDELGAGLSTTSAEGVRAFCLSCHSSSDDKVWDSGRGEYVLAGDEKFEGLRRDGGGGNLLRLPDAAKAAHASTSLASCYDCHGGDETAADGYNVHDPRRAGADPVAAPPATQGDAGSREKTETVGPAVER
jgi:hypothetical protein